jgi:hypothetical protein
VIKHKELEGQLYDAKLAQLSLQLSEEKERNLQEKQQVSRVIQCCIVFVLVTAGKGANSATLLAQRMMVMVCISTKWRLPKTIVSSLHCY